MRPSRSNRRIYLLIAFLFLGITLFAQAPVVLSNSQSLQGQMRKVGAVYIIRGTIDMRGVSVTVPQGCTLKFEGGTLKNGTLTYNNTFIEGNYKIYCKCKGTIANDVVEPHMYGARGDGKTDDFYAIQQSINSGKEVLFRRSTYLVGSPIVFDRQNFIVDFNFATIKKTNKAGCNHKYDSYDFNRIPSVFLIKPYKSNTSGHIVIRNLIIDGGKNNVGIHAIWCRNLILDNIRIYNTTQGFVSGGFTNTYKDITIWDSNEGFVVKKCNAVLFERCFTSHCGWKIEDAKGTTLTTCSSDDFNPCYSVSNSTVSMVGCTQESKGDGIMVKNSVLELSGDFESHIYDSTKKITYLKVSEGSTVYARGCTFHLNNYMKMKIPDSNIFEVYDSSKIELEGKVLHGSGVKVLKANNARMTLNGRSLKNGLNLKER